MKLIYKSVLALSMIAISLQSFSQCDQFIEQLIPTPDNFMECGSFELNYTRVGWSPFIYYGGLKPESIIIETSSNIIVTPTGGNPGWLWNGSGWSFDANNDQNALNDPGDMNDSCTWHFKFTVHVAPCAFNQECMVHVTPYSDGENGPEQFGQLLQWQSMPIAAGIPEIMGVVKPLYSEYYDLRGSKIDNYASETGIIVRKVTFSDGSQKSHLYKVIAGQQ